MFTITRTSQIFSAGPLTLSGVQSYANKQKTITFLEDKRVHRKVTYKIYPTNKAQEDALWNHLKLHKNLYNHCLEKRINAWKDEKISLTFADQCKYLTQLRAESTELSDANAQSQQVTLNRLDLGMKAFWRRLKNGETPGFPRFKSLRRYSGWGYKTHGDGFTFERGPKGDNGRVRLENLGWFECRGRARTPGEPVTAEIMRKADGWYLSLTIKCEPHREISENRKPVSFDWGIENYMTLAEPDDSGDFYDGNTLAVMISQIANPRILYKLRDQITELQQIISRKTKWSKGWKKAVNQLARLKQYEARCRKDFIEKTTAKLVYKYHTIITEELNIKNMTRSARGTIDDPGKNVAQKAGLNKAILDTAPSFSLSRLRVKAEEAVCAWIYLKTRVEAPSQHCPLCGSRHRKELSERIHNCAECGHTESRDGASARYMISRVFGFVRPKKKTRVKKVSTAGKLSEKRLGTSRGLQGAKSQTE